MESERKSDRAGERERERCGDRDGKREKGKVLGFLTEIFRDKTRNNTPER